MRIIRYGLRADSGGAGRYRGGLGAERTFEVLADCELSTQFDQVKFPPPGLHGAGAGAPARILVERDGERQRASRASRAASGCAPATA